MTIGGSDQQGSLPGLSAHEARELAERHGLTKVGIRPPLLTYVGEVWRRRSFLLSMSLGDFIARHQNNYLGVAWSLLNPLLLGAAYFVVFGVLLNTRGNVQNYIGFLISGLLVFIFISGAMNYAAKSLLDNTAMVRALRFPRVILPLSVTCAEFIAAVPAFLVIVIVVIARRETPTWEWLLYPAALAIVGLITAGIGLLFARLLHGLRDVGNLIPLLTRLLRYVSGIFFPVAYFAEQAVTDRGAPQWFAWALEYQPIAISMTIVRETLLAEYAVNWLSWAVAGGWAVVLFLVGFVVFWRAEAHYGRA